MLVELRKRVVYGHSYAPSGNRNGAAERPSVVYWFSVRAMLSDIFFTDRDSRSKICP